ncbi:MAG: rhomboid family intramembrane serine protease [Bacteroidetes bacterium]|nr:rhomboid family intramembrane serine protease [Bacteroidota bacterium]
MNSYTTVPNPGDNLKRFFREGSVLANLIIVNAAVWLLVQVFRIIFFLYNQPDAALATTSIIRIFGVPASVPLLINKPWTILTYMFLHIDVWHVLFNMLWLYWFGKIFQEYLGNRRLLFVYFSGGISGALVYILAFNIFPVFSPSLPISYALGASASVMAIVTAISFKVPNYSVHLLFFGRIRILYLAIALFIFDFFMIPAGNAGGHIAHIGGALFGFLYAQLSGFSSNFISGGSQRWTGFFRKKTMRANVNYTGSRPVSDEEYNLQKAEKQKRMDGILDKISKGGYDSLTRDEKDFLFRSSGKR